MTSISFCLRKRASLAFWLLSSLAICASTLSATQASAQSMSHRLQLSTDITAATAYYVNHDRGADLVGGGVGSPSPIGLGGGLMGYGPLSGLGVGYALDEHWVPNLRANFSYAGKANGMPAATQWSAGPGVRYVLGKAEGTRAFIGAAFVFGQNDLGYWKLTELGANTDVGLQLPITDRVSIDPFLRVTYAYWHQAAENDTAGITLQEVNDHSVALSGGFALSLWL